MDRLLLQYLFEDGPFLRETALSDYDTLDIVSHGCHLYGEILWPDGGFGQLRPCVILLHGFPGSARNDDLAHALCRIGCVVLIPHHRGAWGSEGEYLISNCVEDAVTLADYVRSPNFCCQYRTDPESIYLIGHSMGGCTALNAVRQLPWLRGLVLLTPFDPTRHLLDGEEETLRRLLEQGKILHGDYRPGLIAVKELGVKSPLREAQLNKAEIRQLSKELGLPTWNKQSFACLSSRFVYGETINEEKLGMVDKAEQLLLDLGFHQVRVRIHGMIARIEILPEEFAALLKVRKQVYDTCKALGFTYVTLDLGGYRTGSMNETL